MFQETDTQIIFAVLSSSVLLVFFALLILYSLIRYNKKQASYLIEQEALKLAFAEEKLQFEKDITNELNLKISEEIHDNIGQLLSLSKMQVNLVKNDLQNEKCIAKLDKIEDLLSQSINGLRDIAYKLKAYQQWDKPWKEILETEIKKISDIDTLEVITDLDEDKLNITAEQKLILLRMIQECLQNIIKHARASQITIKTNIQESFLYINIGDNGKGMDVSYSTGMGHQNLIRRAKMINANFRYEQNIPNGTVVKIKMPISSNGYE